MGRTCLLTGSAFQNVRKSYKKLKELNRNICAGVRKGGGGWIFRETKRNYVQIQP